MRSLHFSKLALMTLTALSITACKEFKGDIDAPQDLVFKDSKGKAVTVAAGQRDVKISFPAKDKARIEFSVAGKKNNPKIDFKISKRAKVPNPDYAFHNDIVEVLSKDSGQPYDLVGVADSDIQIGPVQQDWDSCSIEIRNRVCDINQEGKRVCRDEIDHISGYKHVVFRNIEQTDVLRLQLREPASSQIAGDIVADHFDRSRDILREGPCETHHIGRPYNDPFVDFDLYR